jgi:uncharacterized protein (DUF302 family)
METIAFHIALSVDAAVEKLQAAALAVPMGVVAHINGQANCAKKGIEVAADQILEIFRPDFAVKVWQADKRAGLDIPVRIHVCEVAGRTRVACRLPSQVFAPYGNDRLDAIGRELDVVFVRILGALEGAPAIFHSLSEKAAASGPEATPLF